MKMNKFFMGILGVLALSACTSEEAIPDQKPGDSSDGEPRYMSVTIRNTSPMGTRATATNPGEQETVEGGKYEIGYAHENNIKSLRFYFFDGDGNPIAIDLAGRSYFEVDKDDIVNDGNPDMDQTVEKVLNAVILINSNDKEIGKKIKQMVAVANYKSIDSKLRSKTTDDADTKNMSLRDLQDIVGEIIEGQAAKDELNVAADAGNGFVMTSSSYYNNGAVIATTISETDIKESREAALKNPVDIYVERVVAKVRVKAAWNTEKMGEIKDVTFEGATYKAIPLQSKRTDGTTAPIYTATNGSEQLYVIFRNWNLWWTADKSYLFKKVDNWNDVVGDWWNSSTFKRSFWAENPAGVSLNKYPHIHATKTIVTEDFTKGPSNEVAYCLENAAAPGGSGLMATYDPTKTTTPRTLVYLSALLVTVDDGNVAHPVDLAEWAATRNTIDNIKARMFKSTENVIYMRSKDPITSTSGSETDSNGDEHKFGSETYKMVPLTVDDLAFVSGKSIGLANETAETSPRYLSYLHLQSIPAKKGELVLDGKLYKKELNGDYTELSLEDANFIMHNVGGAKIWKGGNTYYYHEINHLNTTDTSGTKGQYGVVRNHIYEVLLQTVYGMGTPVLTPEDGTDPDNWEDIIPQKPSNEFYLGARINILAWRVVSNNVNLEW